MTEDSNLRQSDEIEFVFSLGLVEIEFFSFSKRLFNFRLDALSVVLSINTALTCKADMDLRGFSATVLSPNTDHLGLM
jgi:hypothetical protein